MCGTPPPRGVKKIPQNLHTATHLIFWGFGGFLVKKGNNKIMAQKWSKKGQKRPNQAVVKGFFVMCGTPPPRGVKKNPQNLHTATHLIFWGFGGFWVKKGKKKIRPQNGPKMAPKWSKLPKLPQKR